MKRRLKLVSDSNLFYMQKKILKQKLQDKIAKAIVANNGPLSISEHEAIVSKIKTDSAQAQTEILEAMGAVSKSMFYFLYLYLHNLKNSTVSFVWMSSRWRAFHLLCWSLCLLSSLLSACNPSGLFGAIMQFLFLPKK